jgi:signal recognition particle subunit SRP54
MFDSLSDKLQGVFQRFGSRGTITEKDLDEALREVRLALLEADVHYKVVKEFIGSVRERALGANVTKSLTPMQQIIDIVHQEMIELLGGGHKGLARSQQKPNVIMLVGLKGSGKTTTTAKLALYLRRQGEKTMMVAADPDRVAAVEQLQALGKQLDIPVFAMEAAASAQKVAKAGLEEGKNINAGTVIVDSVGYVMVQEEDHDELRALHQALDPSEVLLVADAMTGQEAVTAAEEFAKAIPVTGLILTKLDGDARGGAALSIRAVTGIPIKLVGVGEKADALEDFYPDRFASRVLGMGDVLTLIDKAKAQLTDEDMESLTVRMKKGQLTLDDFLDQYRRIKNMGPLSQLVGLVPGLNQVKKQLNVDDMDESFFTRVEAIICSMTRAERRSPDIIDGSRRRRIAAGSGTTPADVNQVLKQYKEAKKIIQMISTGRGSQISPLLR